MEAQDKATTGEKYKVNTGKMTRKEMKEMAAKNRSVKDWMTESPPIGWKSERVEDNNPGNSQYCEDRSSHQEEMEIQIEPVLEELKEFELEAIQVLDNYLTNNEPNEPNEKDGSQEQKCKSGQWGNIRVYTQAGV